jgi:hypothetical protein
MPSRIVVPVSKKSSRAIKQAKKKKIIIITAKRLQRCLMIFMLVVVLTCFFYSHQKVLQLRQQHRLSNAASHQQQQRIRPTLPVAFQTVLERAKQNQAYCNGLSSSPTKELMGLFNNRVINNTTIVDLPDFGIIDALEQYTITTTQQQQQSSPDLNWPPDDDNDCALPPETECDATQFSVVFLGYRPDRVGKIKQQVYSMLFTTKHWKSLVHQVVLVWNGPQSIQESADGKVLESWHQDANVAFHIYYPLKQGFPNDLMNRYHPNLNITTKAILYYDDGMYTSRC